MGEKSEAIIIFSIIILFVILLFVIKQNGVKVEKFRGGGHGGGHGGFSGHSMGSFSGHSGFGQGIRPSGGNFSPRGRARDGRNNWGGHRGHNEHGGHHNWKRYATGTGLGLAGLYGANYPYDYNNLFYDNGYYDNNLYLDPVYITQPVIINQVPFEKNNISEEL
jgi:hypothetical protein